MADARKNSGSTSVVKSDVEVITAFQVPIFRLLVNDAGMTEQLRTAILDRYTGRPGVGRSERLQNSNRGGWQSNHDLHEWSSPGIDQLLNRIAEFAHEVVRTTVENPLPVHFEDWLVEAWGNVNVKGARNASHDHYSESRGTLWSGIYYVDPGRVSGENSVDGRTVFEDRIGVPREKINNDDLFSHEMSIEPEPGMMVMFPATLHHRVEPYLGDELRVTIAWNLYHPGFEIPQYGDSEEPHQTLWGSRTAWHAAQVLSAVKGAAKGVVRQPVVLLGGVLNRQQKDTSRGKDADTLREALNDQGRNVSKLIPQDE